MRLDDSQYGDQVQSVDETVWSEVSQNMITWYQENIIPILG